MLPALVAIVALAGIAAAIAGAVRVRRFRSRREQLSRWTKLAAALGAELGLTEEGGLAMQGRTGEVAWTLHSVLGVGYLVDAMSRVDLRFDHTERLAPASVWREPPDEVAERGFLERLGTEEFKLIFSVERKDLTAGVVQWVTDEAVQDILLAIRPYAAAVVEMAGAPAHSHTWIILDDVDETSMRLTLEWAARMAELAIGGVPALPPH